MIVIKSSNIVSAISQPSRDFDALTDVTLSVTDESTNIITATILTATLSNGAIVFSHDFNAVEGRYYFVVITQGVTELVKFKIFCTDQTDLQDYKVTEGDFTTAPQANDTIIVA